MERRRNKKGTSSSLIRTSNLLQMNYINHREKMGYSYYSSRYIEAFYIQIYARLEGFFHRQLRNNLSHRIKK